MWLPCLLYLLFNLWAVTIAGPGLADVVRSTFLAVNVCTELLLANPELEFGKALCWGARPRRLKL